MARLRLELLGGLQVLAAGDASRPLAVPGRKVQALLVLLALPPGRLQPRARLATLLWGDSGEAQARASLRQALLVLRRALDLRDTDLIGGPGETLGLAADCVEVDAIEFERLVADGSPAALEQAAALHRGEFCEALDTHASGFDDWLAGQRERLREGALALWSRLLALHADAGHHERAIDAALRLLALDPLQEPVHRQLMQLYARQGRRGAALRQFQICRELLARELGTPPQAQTLALRDAIERRPEPAVLPAAGDAGAAAAGVAELRPLAVLVAESQRLADDDAAPSTTADGERFVARAIETVELFGGSAERRLGSGIGAWFGVPLAHGDDIERAARCALRLRELASDLRVGLACGPVLVTARPAGGPRAFGVDGAVPALAARLAAVADAGEVLVAPGAWRVLARVADGERCASDSLPASLRAAGAWRLQGLRAPVARSGLVGRRAEIGQFSGRLQACRDDATGLTIHLRGDPGIGKSRLVDEFRQLALAEGYGCHDAAVLDFGDGLERDAVRTLLRGLLEVDADGEAAERAAVARVLRDGLLDTDDELHLFELLSLPLAPAQRLRFDAMDDATRARRADDVLARLLVGRAARQPRLLVIEDLHWAPPRTLRQVAVLAAAVERCAALLVCTTRSDGDPLDAAWRAGAGIGSFVTFDLGPLRWAEASALAAQIGGAADAFTLRCVERSGGNPLFLEQLLQDGPGAADGTLPESVQAVVQARLDRLPAAARQVVRIASVLGQRFSLAALRHLLGDAGLADDLSTRGLLRLDTGEGAFAHALVHEGAYASLPRAQRRELHLRAARWYGGRDAILRAEHLDRAEDGAAAQAYLDAAGAQAAAHHHERALRLAERGLACAADDGPRFALGLCRAASLHDLGRMAEAQAAYESTLEIAGDDAQRCRAWLGLATVLRVRDALDAAAELLRRAEQVAAARGLTEALARVHFLRGNLLFPRGDLDGVRREHERSLALARSAGSVELEVGALGGLGDAEFLRGRMVSARRHFEACVALARRQGLQRVEAANLPMAAIARLYGGEGLAAAADARTAVELAQRIGHHRAELIGHHGAYQSLQGLGDFDGALWHAERSIVLAREIDAPRFVAEGLAFRGELRRCLGLRAQAVDDLQQALQIARATGMAYMGPIFLGMLALACDDVAMRERALAEAEALLATNHLAHNHLLFRRDAIDAGLEAGDVAAARRHADALAAITQAEPLPWSDFFVARARALAAARQDGPAVDRSVLEGLRAQGLAIGQHVAVGAIDAMLAA